MNEKTDDYQADPINPEQFSERFCIRCTQTWGMMRLSFDIPRLRWLDEKPELTDSDMLKVGYHAGIRVDQGLFQRGYFDVALVDMENHQEEVDFQHAIT